MDEFAALVHLIANAPTPSQEYIELQCKLDKMRNTIEIIVDYKIEAARLMFNKLHSICKHST